MASRIDTRVPGGSGPSRGRCYLYVLPCMYEDILKLGFSREPLDRMQALHQRWFEFFDLDRAFLIETDTVRDARVLESGLAGVIGLHNAPAPLVIRKQADGHTEWYRGAYGTLRQATQALEAGGYIVHRTLRPWISQILRSRGDMLFSWTSAMLSPDEMETPNAGVDGRHTDAQRTVRDALDACVAFDIDLEPLLPVNVLDWYSRQQY